MSDIKPTPAEQTDISSTVITEAPTTTTTETAPLTTDPVENKQESEVAPVETEAKTEEPTEAATTETVPEAEESPKELEPITEGVLETKISFIPIFLKKYTYYFSDDPIAEGSLSDYLKKEKTKSSQANYAHATQTGKGLLFYTKSDKTKPAGILRLDGATITTQGDKKFTIKGPDHETHLEAPTTVLRQRWYETLKSKVEEAEGVHAGLVETDGFKTALEKFKPVSIGAAAALVKDKKDEVVEDKKEDKKEEEEEDKEKEAKKATKKAKKEQKKKEKEEKKAAATAAGTTVDDDSSSSSSSSDEDEPVASTSAAAATEKKEEKKDKRSVSKTRNRFSFFGSKKEEKKEEKKEGETVAEAKEETPIVPATTESAPINEAAPTTTEPAPIAPVAETPAETAKEVEEPKTETSPVTSPKSNRMSFLGNLPFLKKKDEKKPEATATTPEETPKSPDPVPEVVATSEVQPLTSTKGTDPQANEPVEESAKTETPAESSKSPALGIVDNIKSTLLGKKEEKASLPDAGETKDREPAAVEATTETPKEDEPVESPKDRKPSFFGSLRRDKSTEGTEEKVKRSLSFWKKDKKVAGKEETPAITEAEPAATTEAAPIETVKTEPATKEVAAPVVLPDTTGSATESEVVDGKIGDVVPAAVTVGGEPSKV